MTKVKSPLVTIAGKYGLMGGFTLLLALIILFYVGKHPLLIPLLFDLRIFLFSLFLVLGIREFKEFNGDELHFWQGMATGIIIYMVITFIATMGLLVFAGLINPDFVTEYVRLSTETFLEDKEVWVESLGEERFNTAINSLPSTTANDLAFDYFLKSTPIGFILTLITSLFLRK